MTEQTSNIFDLINGWEDSKSVLASAKQLESTARHALVKAAFPGELTEGVQSKTLEDGRILKVTGKMNYKLSEAEKVEAALGKLADADDAGDFIGQRLVKRKLELAIGEFKKLSPKLKKIFEKVVTISPVTPEVEIVRPKVRQAA